MKTKKHHGSFMLRFMILGFSIAVGVLTFWLLGYVLRDIDRVKGPDYNQMIEAGVPQELQDARQALAAEAVELKQQIASAEERRRLTVQTTNDSQQTINQLLELKRNADENETKLSEDQQQALTDSLQLFLSNQSQMQVLNAELATLNEQKTDVSQKQQDNARAITAASRPIENEYERLQARHQWRLAAYKLGLLIPVLLICGWMFVRQTGGTYSMLVYALSGAVAARVILVMHEHFPAIYFRYILILLSLAIAIGVLLRLLRLLANPSRDWLIRQYREAYASFFCPICDYPIHRGPLKFAVWTRRSLKKRSLAAANAGDATADQPYTCPCCETTLFEACEKCGGIRHSLLPACEKCGDAAGRAIGSAASE
ncbi:hypothetical protein [Allorhodopirellula solitaria]|uniref:Transmembrane protein n=1 Tax=Allorhodopirellula solitaria TaxID=2527987 RepID=A0A5C5YCX5_9BACT|nr:hypothetical protein [Allorhodopirellula solitaria]TWT73230.1 hypothetical protein CA85_16980 [Allorhodopirellula solitaria]